MDFVVNLLGTQCILCNAVNWPYRGINTAGSSLYVQSSA